MLKIIIHLFVFTFLTILTQVGGIAYLLALFITYRLQLSSIKATGLFLGIYLFATSVVIPFTAPFFGRTALPITGNLRPLTILTCLLNRHYVRPELKKQLVSIADQMNGLFKGTRTNYLDANFPFGNGFPLFPHLSHNDGRKIDLAFYYVERQTGKRSGTAPSFIGYGIYDGPKDREVNYPDQCRRGGFWQYGFLTYVVPKWRRGSLR